MPEKEKEKQEQENPSSKESVKTEASPEDIKKDIEDNKVVAAVSYVWILSLVVLFAKYKSPFALFHARQGVVLFIISALLFTVFRFLNLLQFFGLVQIILLVLSVVGFLHAAMGQKFKIPVIYQLSVGDFNISKMIKSSKEGVKELQDTLKTTNKVPEGTKPAAEKKEGDSKAINELKNKKEASELEETDHLSDSKKKNKNKES